MSHIMGCEVVPSSSLGVPVYEKLLTKMGLDVLKVPVRMNGLTSSGTKGRCYHNVANLVEVFGGKVVTGFTVTQSTSILGKNKRSPYQVNIAFHGHAVWLNEEGKLSDPTAKNWVEASMHAANDYDRFALYRESNKFYLKFIPIKIGAIDDCYGCESIIMNCKFDHLGNKIGNWNIHAVLYEQGGIQIPLKLNAINPELIESLIMFQFNWKRQFGSWDRFREFAHREGNFKALSSVTGKTLDEIRSRKITTSGK